MIPALIVLTLAVPPAAQAPGDEAHRLAVLAIREYNDGDFATALRDAKRAYELSGLSALLFNLGQCYRALGEWREAEHAYRSYLRERPGARNRGEVASLIAEMKTRESSAPPPAAVVVVSPTSASPSPPRTAPPPPPRAPDLAPPAAGPAASGVPREAVAETRARGQHGSPAAWWLGGSGLVALAGGTVLGVLAAGNDGTTTRPNGVVTHSVTGSSYVAGQYEGLGADILWPLGGVLVAAAVAVALASH